MQTAEIRIEHLFKSYQNIVALNDINLEIRQGELFGFIGPDGAGKTTLFRILSSLMIPDKGKASMMGLDVVANYKEIRKKIGYMPGRFSLYQDLTVEENLRFFAGVHGASIEDNYHLIKDIYSQIEPFKDRSSGKLSGGMKQKLALSCALIHRPKVLLLDEPTTGVDAVSRQEFWAMLKKLREAGLTILVSTPYMDEASLCDRVALIQKGTIMDVATPDSMIAQFGFPLISVRSSKMNLLLDDLKSLAETKMAYRFGDAVHGIMELDNKKMLIEALLNKGHEKIECETITPTIEDCFLLLMQTKDE